MNKFSIAAIAVLSATQLFSCGSEEAASKPIKENAKQEAAAPDVNTKPSKFDPAKAQAEEPSGPMTSIAFNEYVHDFGVMDEGDKCKGSCGCTVPECPKEAIAPGATGSIEVKFNSKGKKNKQTKKVTVTANTDPAQTILTINAQVTPAPAPAK